MTYLRLDQLITKPTSVLHQHASRVALVTDSAEYTYEELNERANKLAGKLRELGLQRGDRILVLMHNRVEWFDLYFAAAKLSAVIVPANYMFVPAELDYLIEDSGARFVMSESGLCDKLDHLTERPEFAGAMLVVDADRPGWLRVDVETYPFSPGLELEDGAGMEEPFLLQYTSGTTGRPKAAIHTQATILFNVLQQIGDYDITAEDTYVLIVALAWVAGFHSFTLATFMVGGRVVLQPNHAIDAASLTRALDHHQATISGLPPVIIRRMLELDAFTHERLGRLRMVFTGSEPVPAELLSTLADRLPGCDVVQIYGMTEGPFSGTYLPARNAIAKVGSVGKGGLISYLRVVNVELEDVEVGEVGEIVVRSPGTATGYWRRPEETAATFADGWFRTGDLATVDEDGFVFIAGRRKDMIISGGLNIYPAELEHAIMRHPAVREVAVVGSPDEKWGETPTAVVVLKDPVSEAELSAHARENLAKFKVPKKWVVLDEPLPRTASGKLQKFKIVDRLTSASEAPAQASDRIVT
ncbi:class I adenylate-forming enzyme family protein [Georgenia sp. SYP-B2076]|uniref:class I adenylate-forming enzyme family protein n=1 Tax=Georgenia sp. SYP-B2076 TaxID=2495881 RepID=UPI000F8DBCAA|nr:AMP-binding protein [Georgenia sp. SYP-B2076]